jgi:glycosyltransferase involved in cell wall biosynthesis
MRVLAVLVGAAARTGGPPAFVGGSALELARLGVDMRVVTTDLALAPWGIWQRQRRVRREELHPTLAKADTHVFAARFPRRLAFSPGLSRSLRELTAGYDVVHVHNLWQFPQYAGYRAALDADVPYIVSPHGGLDPYLRRRGRIRKQMTAALWQDEMLAQATLIHVTTEAEKELIADVAPHVPRAVVPCGLNVAEFSNPPPPDAFRQQRLDGYDGPLIVFLGRITQKKGVDVLIRAFAEVASQSECRLAIVGPDDAGMVSGLRRLVGDLGIDRHVVFLDAVYGDERLAVLSSADVWALSSHTENFGIAVTEAMAAGCAVVVSKGVNLAADIAAADAGIVTEATPHAFGHALLEMLADDQRRARLRQTARTFAARYDWSLVAPRVLEMYRKAAAA